MLSSKDRIEFIAQIRHQCTNYEKLSNFYYYYKNKRSELNSLIGMLLDNAIEIPEFRKRVSEIENYIDLNIKSNRKRFIEEETARLRLNVSYNDTKIKNIIKCRLSKLLKTRPKKAGN